MLTLEIPRTIYLWAFKVNLAFSNFGYQQLTEVKKNGNKKWENENKIKKLGEKVTKFDPVDSQW